MQSRIEDGSRTSLVGTPKPREVDEVVTNAVVPTRREWLGVLLGSAGAALAVGCDAGTDPVVDQESEGLLGSSAILWGDTIADLRAVTTQGTAANKTSTVAILGYGARGDGGGGVFEWIKTNCTPPSTVDDGGTTILPTTQPTSPNGPGYWLRTGTNKLIEQCSPTIAFARPSSLSSPVNVKWFGATGNGTTDDSAAIQAAANALVNSGGSCNSPMATI